MTLTCYHCDLPVPKAGQYQVIIFNEQRDMCCPGCQAVAETIIENGLENYYSFRSEPGKKVEPSSIHSLSELLIYDEPSVQEDFVVHENSINHIQLSVEGIRCAACGWLIEKRLRHVDGIAQINVNVSASRAWVKWNPRQINLSQILNQIERVGYTALPFQPDKHEALYQNEHKSYLKNLGLAGLLGMQVMMLALGLYFGLFGYIDKQTEHYFAWVSLFLTLPVVTFSARVFYLSAYRAIRAGNLNMDVPISIAIVFIFSGSVSATFSGAGDIYYESVCMFVFLLLIGRYLEHNSRRQASLASANMLKYIPVKTTLVTDKGDQLVLAKSLRPGDKVRIRSGETIPADGKIHSGQAWIDEAILTGEFEPNLKTAGDKVKGGTLNQEGSITVFIESALKDAFINQILRLQEQALSFKPRVLNLADRVASYFVLGVLLVSTGTFIFWWHYATEQALWIGVSVLVATCPCALGLATPSALNCALQRLNRNGILLKKADTLERLTEIDTLVLDKTGTLTEGNLRVRSVQLLGTQSENHVLELASALEKHSEHPIAKAFSVPTQLTALDIKVETGRGISGKINGKHYRIGNARFTQANTKHTMASANVFLCEENNLIAAFSLQDTPRQGSQETLAQFNALDTVLLSGDSSENVQAIAKACGIENWLAEQSPQMKLDYVNQLQQQGKKTLMVGDGVNDGPVLAAAYTSVAVANATDVAKNAADSLLLHANLRALVSLHTTAKQTRNIVIQNIGWALAYNICVLPAAMMGFLTPWIGVIGMSLSSIIVVTNSTRLLK
jgi:Cu2+-exporting ATPase